MANVVGVIKAVLDVDVSSVRRAMRDVKRQFKDTFGADTQRDIKNLGRNMQNVSQHAKDMGSHLKSVERIVGGILISQAFYKMAGSISEASKELYTFMGEMDKAEIAFENFLDGNNQRAQAFLYNMQDFAAETSFDSAQANQLSMQLMAAQFDPTQIRSMMEVLNDAAAGSGAGAEAIDRIVYAMNQIKTKGKLMAEELRQLANANIPIYKILADQLGIAEDKLTDIGELNISGDMGVAALLQGLEKQYKGTAERVSNTVPGLMANIKDNLLVLGNDLFEAPYNAFGGFLKGIRERLDELREITANTGIGGLFVELFGEEVTQKIRLVIAAVMKFAAALKQLAQAVSPVVKALAGMLLSALATVLPPLSQIINFLANLINAIMQAVPPLKYLIAAIAGLAIAFAAGKALMFLWTITGMGVICSAVAKAVIILRNAILLLFKVVGKSKLVMAITLIITVLMGLALSSAKATAWIEKLMAKLQNLMGLDTDGILEIKDDGMADLADEFNNAYSSVKDVMNATDESGDAAEDAAKKYKKWLASFDEVFQVPEPEDEEEDSLFNIPDFTMPDLDLDGEGLDIDPIDIDIEVDLEDPEIGPWIARVKKKIKDVSDDIKGKFQFEFSFAKSLESVKNWGTNLGKSFRTAFQAALNAGTILQGLGSPALEPVLEPVGTGAGAPATAPKGTGVWDDLKAGWQQYQTDFSTGLSAIGGLAQTAWNTIATSSGLMWADMKTNFKESMTDIGDWFVDAGGAISSAASTAWGAAVDMGAIVAGWFSKGWEGASSAIGSGVAAIGTFFKEHWDKLLVALGVIALAVVAVLLAPFTAIGGAVTGAATMVGMAITAAVAGLALLIAPFWDEIKAWFSGTWDALSGWASTFVATIGKWGTDAWNAISGAFSNMWTSVSTWVSDTSKAIADWAVNTWNTFTTWVSDTATAFAGWVSGIVTAIAGWAVNFATTLSTALTNGLKAIGQFALDGIKAISQFVTDFFKFMSTLPGKLLEAIKSLPAIFKSVISQYIGIVSSVISSVLTFFRNLPGNILSFIRSIPGNFKTLLGELPGLASSAIGQFIDKFKGIPGKVWEHIKSIPSLFVDALKNIPGVSFLGKGVSFIADGFGKLGQIAGFENGGIIGQDSIVRVGEKGKREAIIPLQNKSAMQPFVDAVVQGIGGRPQQSQDNNEQQPILYVGTLIADDRSLRELERKMRVVRTSEDKRGVR